MKLWSLKVWVSSLFLTTHLSYAAPSELRRTLTIFLGDYSNNYVSTWRVLESCSMPSAFLPGMLFLQIIFSIRSFLVWSLFSFLNTQGLIQLTGCHFSPLWRVVSAISFLFNGIFDDRAEKCYISQCWFSLHADFYLLFNIIMMALHGGKP